MLCRKDLHKILILRICFYQQTKTKNKLELFSVYWAISFWNVYICQQLGCYAATLQTSQHFHKINTNRIGLFVPSVQPDSHTNTNGEKSECNNEKKTRLHSLVRGVQFLNPRRNDTRCCSRKNVWKMLKWKRLCHIWVGSRLSQTQKRWRSVGLIDVAGNF